MSLKKRVWSPDKLVPAIKMFKGLNEALVTSVSLALE